MGIAIGVYLIRNLVTGRVYVGSSSNIPARWRYHRNLLNRGAHSSRRLQRSWKRRGEAAFSWEIIEAVAEAMTLLSREQFWIDHFKATDPKHGYNISPRAGAPSAPGIPLAPEHRAKIKAACLVAKRSAEHIANIVAANKRRAGKKASAETKARLAAAQQALLSDPKYLERLRQHGRNLAVSRRGTHHTEETKRKIAATKIGKAQTPESNAKRSAAQKGRFFSPEHRAKLSAAAKRQVRPHRRSADPRQLSFQQIP